MIEKDDEQLIEIGDTCYMPQDPVMRQYIPIREKYIIIVKSCRSLTIDSLDKRGRRDMKRTTRNLIKKAKSINSSK